ncbi:hypothetical protein [Salinarimonas soli]|uniref:Uncharacterized protein n=1 Tax=Salinarimonas soli TaxID=1638099 RepID=A0A5B2VNB2_9HYPH|nr:hypothetical protein [Salinarimonas soli]KAA2241143.1 hypothetical protein F0L46_04920 [Salinarimonas soli]
MAPVPALPDLRALPLMDSLLPGHALHLITDGASWPHLCPGEFAVIDTADRVPAVGELFVIEWSSGRREVVETYLLRRSPRADGSIPWAVAPFNRPRSLAELAEWREAGRPMVTSEGPFRPERLSEKLVGRVAGIFAPAFDPSLKRVGPEAE